MLVMVYLMWVEDMCYNKKREFYDIHWNQIYDDIKAEEYKEYEKKNLQGNLF